MDQFLTSIQQSGFARFIGESGSKWGYPFVLFMHTLGLGIVAGVSAGIALRVLGFGRGLALESLDRLFPVMWFGFILSAVSGLALLATDPVTDGAPVPSMMRALVMRRSNGRPGGCAARAAAANAAAVVRARLICFTGGL